MSRSNELGEFMGEELFLNLEIGKSCEADTVIPAEPSVEAVYEMNTNPIQSPRGLGERREACQYLIAYRGPFGLEALLVPLQSRPGFTPDLLKTCHSSFVNLPKQFRKP